MLKLLKPILLGLFSEKIIKQLIIDILRLLVKKTSNDLDNRAVDFLEQQLFPGRKLTQLPR